MCSCKYSLNALHSVFVHVCVRSCMCVCVRGVGTHGSVDEELRLGVEERGGAEGAFGTCVARERDGAG